MEPGGAALRGSSTGGYFTTSGASGGDGGGGADVALESDSLGLDADELASALDDVLGGVALLGSGRAAGYTPGECAVLPGSPAHLALSHARDVIRATVVAHPAHRPAPTHATPTCMPRGDGRPTAHGHTPRGAEPRPGRDVTEGVFSSHPPLSICQRGVTHGVGEFERGDGERVGGGAFMERGVPPGAECGGADARVGLPSRRGSSCEPTCGGEATGDALEGALARGDADLAGTLRIARAAALAHSPPCDPEGAARAAETLLRELAVPQSLIAAGIQYAGSVVRRRLSGPPPHSGEAPPSQQGPGQPGWPPRVVRGVGGPEGAGRARGHGGDPSGGVAEDGVFDDADEGEGEGGDTLADLLDAGAPGAGRDRSLTGFPLTLSHFEDNPFPRSPAFRSSTCHADPRISGDHASGETVRRLRQQSKPFAADEACTLFSVVSYLWDTREHARMFAAELVDQLGDHHEHSRYAFAA